MKQLINALYRPWIKQFTLAVAFLTLFGLSYLCIFFLAHSKVSPLAYSYLALTLLAFFIPITLAWFGYRLLVFGLFGPAGLLFTILVAYATNRNGFLIFIPAQIILGCLLYFMDEKKEAEMIVYDVETEKAVNEKNDLELAFQQEGTSISVFFEKYASYYNLRNIASDFSTSLSLKELSQIVVTKTMELLTRGNWCLLFLADPESGSLALVASKTTEDEKKRKIKSGDIFDHWVVRNRQSLIVTDTQRDFRFDLSKNPPTEDVRSVIAAPIVHERKVIGTLRITSAKPESFNTDDLRLLDAISTLASSAISNCLLYQRTEELAIRDSLTGLFVQRYFLERLLEEHGRSLLAHTPLTLLMCDLDHFKSWNDQYGHGVGDYILKKVSELIVSKTQDGIAARYGGEEFAILLPKQSAEQGRRIAESIRAELDEKKITVRRAIIPVTISIGFASIPEDTLDAEELIRIADNRLYHAKKTGRNKTCGRESLAY